MKTQTSEANLGIENLLNPPLAGIDRSKNFLIDFYIWNVKIGVGMRKLWLFYEQTRIRGQNGPEVGKICGGG